MCSKRQLVGRVLWQSPPQRLGPWHLVGKMGRVTCCPRSWKLPRTDRGDELRCGHCPTDHRILRHGDTILRPLCLRPLRRNAKTDAAHGFSNALMRRFALIQREPKFRHQCHLNIRDPRQAFHCAAHLGGAGSAICACDALLLLCLSAVCHLRPHSGFPPNKHIRPTATVAPSAL